VARGGACRPLHARDGRRLAHPAVDREWPEWWSFYSSPPLPSGNIDGYVDGNEDMSQLVTAWGVQ